MSVKVIYFILSIFWINYCGPVDAEGWSGTLDESVDEQNDAEIFRAVVESMRQWELHKKTIHRVKREASRVCYEDVGCFEDTGPFSYLEMLPSPPKDVGTRFFVYGSRKARSVPMEVPADDINEKAHNAIDQELPTKVIVHGFGSGCDHVWVYEMRSALMSVHDCNIVCVDWSPGSVLPNYVRAAANTRLVGRQLAKLIRGLDVPLDKVHLIGFSLGAHVAGFAGAELGNVSRITGLDPAGPLFESQDPRARLDESDANFVDVIHSNGEQLILGGLGSWQPMGDVDFYPNGGRMQTGCSNLFVGAVSDIIWTGTIEGRSLCNHRRAYKLFTDSVSPKCRFPSFPCEKGYDGLLQGDCFPCGYDRPCGDMGYYSDVSNARGQLYLVTREEEPFCAHQYQIKLFNSRSERPARSYGKLQVTLVGAGGFNETFTMTRKDDEELVVGAILHKIVVPHPVVIDLEAIEVKYTAYSGWISSGLASWSIDKVSVLDSFGKSLSICRRGLILESGHQIHLPLYPGECNIPIDTDKSDNSTLNVTETSDLLKNNQELEKTETKITGIGPFTKDQNFEKNFDHKDSYTIDMVPLDRQRPTKNIGPFTKDQNIRITEETPSKPPEDPKQTIWTFVDINETGNSLENPEPSETGRGFSNPYIPPPTKPLNPPQNPPEFPKIDNLPEIQEPVLQIKKKETGRSMRLPEITEPILRPRMTRQNPKNPDPEGTGLQSKEKINEEDPKGFTVQFLPERLAGLFAQAERYARQTLLPLISQYTPSFISGSRKERLKYFPPLEVIEVPSSESSIASPNDLEIADDRKNKESAAFNEEGSIDRSSDWVPIAFSSSTERNESSFRASDNSEGKWINREGKVLFQSPSKAAIDSNNEKMMNNSDTKSPGTITNNEDWIPITDKPSANVEVDGLANKKGNPTLQSTLPTTNTSEVGSERRFIPLVDFENPNDSLVLSSDKRNDEDVVTTTESNERILSHIQKIKSGGGNNGFRNFETRSMAFPYAYERKTDPRTRYIPLVPEEDLGKRGILQEREE